MAPDQISETALLIVSRWQRERVSKMLYQKYATETEVIIAKAKLMIDDSYIDVQKWTYEVRQSENYWYIVAYDEDGEFLGRI